VTGEGGLKATGVALEQVIFFDLDGTLLDHETAVRAGVASFLGVFRDQFPGDAEAFFRRWEATAEKYLESYDNGKPVSFQAQRRRRMNDIFGRVLPEDDADRKFQVYLEAYEAHWRLYPDSEPCLNALRGRAIGLITNGDGTQQRAKLAKVGFSKLFLPAIISREVGWAKPQAEIFEIAAREAGVPASRCLYVGDRLESDARAAARAGMRGIWLNRKDHAQAQGITTIHGLTELPGIIANFA